MALNIFGDNNGKLLQPNIFVRIHSEHGLHLSFIFKKRIFYLLLVFFSHSTQIKPLKENLSHFFARKIKLIIIIIIKINKSDQKYRLVEQNTPTKLLKRNIIFIQIYSILYIIVDMYLARNYIVYRISLPLQLFKQIQNKNKNYSSRD